MFDKNLLKFSYTSEYFENSAYHSVWNDIDIFCFCYCLCFAMQIKRAKVYKKNKRKLEF